MPDTTISDRESDEEKRVRQWTKPPSSLYDIHNPLVHRRVIHDCLSQSGGSAISINPGETKTDVELANHVAKGLLAQKDDLQLTPSSERQGTVAATQSEPPVVTTTQSNPPVKPAVRR